MRKGIPALLLTLSLLLCGCRLLPERIPPAGLTVHFIDVGQADCALLESGVAPAAQSMQGIGYKELIPAAMGQDDVNRAVWDIIVHTRHYAKRQGTWLRAEPRCVWLDARDADGLLSKALALAQAFLNDTKEQDE